MSQPQRAAAPYQEAALANGGEPQAGRRLLSWARAAGFTDVTPSSSTWCFANPQERQYWGGMWTDRILQSALTTQLLDSGMATPSELQAISEAFRSWISDEDGCSASSTQRSSPDPSFAILLRAPPPHDD